MKHVLRLAILGLATTSLINCTDVADPVPVDDDGTQIDRDEGRPLTPPSTDAPASIVRSYLSGRVAGSQLNVTGQSTSRGVTHVRFEQVVDGLRVHGAYAKAALSSRGELLQVIHRIVPTSKTTKLVAAQAIESDALRTAMVELGYGIEPARVRTRGNVTAFAQTSEMYREPTVERVAYSDETGTLRVGFVVETWSQVGNQLDYTLVGGDGRVLSTEMRTNNDSYNVFVEDPDKGGQTVVTGPGAGNIESPAGWLSGTQTTINITGNNAHGYLDAVSNNTPDSGGTDVTSGNFLTAANLLAAPGTTDNRAVAVQNLFYLNNVAHDTLYRHGFIETTRNFQTNNFGKGGLGNDAVNAEAQDGGGTDNANFATPSDGSAPRMQMYLWTGSAPSAVVTVNSEDHDAYQSSFGPALSLSGTSGALALLVDGTAPANDGCSASTVSLAGKIAVVDRGTCDFTVKVRNAQAAGAAGVLIANNIPSGGAFSAGGTDRKVAIPSAMISYEDGQALRGLTANALLKKNPVVALQIDGDVDADIVFHEYGHGLTWRMIGGMSGAFAGGIGEGASDVLAFLMNCSGAAANIDGTCDDRIGEYSYSNLLGIRREPYNAYTLTYSSWNGAEVHNDGEIYAAAMWRVLKNYQAAGLTSDDLLGDFVDGMNNTPVTPKPEQMRDGMLQSVAGTGRECLIWRGFAATGIGVGAAGVLTKGGRSVSVSQSFALPAGCAAP